MSITTLPATPIVIDTRYEYEFQYIYAKQYDTGTRYVEAAILDNGLPITISDNTQAILRYTKPDKKGGLIELGKLTTNVVHFELTEQMLSVSGKVTVDLELYEYIEKTDGSGVDKKSISTATFYIEVAKAALTEETIISSNEFSMLVNVLVRCEDALNRVDTILPEMEQARDDCMDATNTINENFDKIKDTFQYIVDTTQDTVNYALAAKTYAANAKTSEDNAKLSETNAKASEISADNDATIAYNQADRAQYYAEQAKASEENATSAKDTTITTLDDFNANINSFRKKTDLIAKSDLTINLQNELDGKASTNAVRLNSIPITESDLDYNLALKVNNGGGGTGGIPVAGAQIDDTAPSYSKVFSSQKTVNYFDTALASALSGIEGLSDNNFTTAEKIKLGRIENNANYYEHPLTHPSSIITTTPDRDFISDVEKQLYSDKYTKAEIDNMIAQISSGIIWKPNVNTYQDIVTTYPSPEYNWCVNSNDGTYLYNGTQWIKIGSGIVPLATNTNDGLMSSSNYYKLNQIADGANKYIHPSSHSADMIAESGTRKFVTPAMYTKINDLDSFLADLLSSYRLKTTKILESDLDQIFLDKVANAGGTIINDNLISTAQTYSSAVIESKLKVLINSKADSVHTHTATDISETASKQFITSDDKDKVSKIIIDGSGTQYLSDDGTYKPANSSVIVTNGDGTHYLADDGTYKQIKISAAIDDTVVSSQSTYSSEKINAELNQKANTSDLHNHDNQNILDDITMDRYTKWEEKTNMIDSTGSGNRFFADDGTYKVIDGISSPINDADAASTTTTFSASKVKDMIDTTASDLSFDLTQKINTKVDAVASKGLSTNDYNDIDKNKVASLDNTGSDSEFLAKDGYYYPINNVGINNSFAGDNTTYSGNEIDKRINDGILNLVLPTQNDSPTMWKKNYENVTAGQILEMQTSLNFSMNNAIIQVYKYMEGQKNVEKVISTFTINDKDNYFYNSEDVTFSNENGGIVKIRDSYPIPVNLNSDGFFESELITKDEYLYINSVELN